MTPAKIKEHEPTTVSSDPSDQTIVGQVKQELILKKPKKNIDGVG